MAKRLNGNGTLWKILGIAITLGAISLGVAAGYGRLCSRVDGVETKTKTVSAKADANEKCITEMKTDLKWILSGQKEQKQLLEEIRQEISK